MDVFIKPPSRLRPLRKERSPVKAAIIGFLFGPIGVGLYFKSVIDFLIPELLYIATLAVLVATHKTASFVGILGVLTIAGRWGYYRARQSNKRLADARNLLTDAESAH